MALDADTQFEQRHHFTAGALVRRSADRRGGRQRQGRQPHQHDHALAGAGIYRGAESGTPRAFGAGHADRGAGRGGRLAARCAAGRWAAFPPTRWPKTRISPSPSRPRAIRCSSTPRPSPGQKRPPPCSGLAKQRFRWAYGTLQCLWKYRSITFNPRYGELGMVALPQVWLFQILLTTLAPVADLLLVWQLIGAMDRLYPAWRGITPTTISSIVRHLLCRLHRGRSAGGDGRLCDGDGARTGGLLWWLPLQRFGYRQIMYYVVVRSHRGRRCAGPLSAGASSNGTAPSRQATLSECNAGSRAIRWRGPRPGDSNYNRHRQRFFVNSRELH